MKKRIQKLREYVKENTISVDPLMRFKYDRMKRHRQVGNYLSLPSNCKEELRSFFEANSHIDNVFIFGSYVNGDYVNRTTDKDFIELRKLITQKTKVSDIDVFLDGEYTLPEGSIIQVQDSCTSLTGFNINRFDVLQKC